MSTPAPSGLRARVESLGGSFLSVLEQAGAFLLLFLAILRRLPILFARPRLVAAQVHFLGNYSLAIILVSGLFVGLVLGLQGYYTLRRYGSEEALGLLVALSLVRELGPVVTALLFAGRAGTALTAEIGLMKAGEQLSAMEAMAVDPVARVLAPRLAGGLIAVPVLATLFSAVGIIVFAALVLIGIWLLISQTRLGLFIRSVTQNRSMAACVGVNTAKVDMLAFGLGSGIAGLAGVALSQIGNVGPDLGQAYIIDSFMVVVLGGVGQLAGTVYAALGLGVFSKFIEPGVGAVLTKIIILVFIIAVIQKRPQGLFALKGRSVEG